MYRIDLDKMIAYLVDTQMERFSPHYKALHFPFDVSLSYHTDEDSFIVRATGEFLFRRANNATNVWFRCPVLRTTGPLEGWENISNHTSCWRDSIRGALGRFHRKHEAKLREQCDPERISECIFLMDKMSFKYVDFEKDKEKHRNFILTEIKPWKEEYSELHPYKDILQ